MNHNRSGTTLKGSIRKVPFIRDYNDQDNRYKHTREHQHLPPRYAPTLHAVEGNGLIAPCQLHQRASRRFFLQPV
jgi:hypothetical protein